MREKMITREAPMAQYHVYDKSYRSANQKLLIFLVSCGKSNSFSHQDVRGAEE